MKIYTLSTRLFLHVLDSCAPDASEMLVGLRYQERLGRPLVYFPRSPSRLSERHRVSETALSDSSRRLRLNSSAVFALPPE